MGDTRFWNHFKQFGTKTGVRLIDLAKFLATTGIWVSMVSQGKISSFTFLTSNKEIMDDSHDLD